MALASLCKEATDPSSMFACPREANDSARTRPRFTAFIVDHRLRSHSTQEARDVSSEISRLGIESRILDLDWTKHGDPRALPNLESVARRLRFQALGRACLKRGIDSLLLAHHRDDQAETVMLRVLAGYGGAGLRGIRAEAAIPECAGLYGVDHSGRPELCGDHADLTAKGESTLR